MKKMKNLGFMLAETLIVSVVVMGVLIVMYVQFNNINKNYNLTFNYNSANNLYSVKNINDYLLTEDLSNIKKSLGNNLYIDITNCSLSYYSETYYCQNLYELLNVKQILFTNEDVTRLKANISENNDLSEEMKSFINYIYPEKLVDKYRLIVEFNDNTFATLQVSEN